MICRIWHGWTSLANAVPYERLLLEDIFAGIVERRIPGLRGIQLLRREGPDEVEFVNTMWSEDLDAVRAFAGAEYERAAVPAPARALLARFDERAAHYEVHETRGQAGGKGTA